MSTVNAVGGVGRMVRDRVVEVLPDRRSPATRGRSATTDPFAAATAAVLALPPAWAPTATTPGGLGMPAGLVHERGGSLDLRPDVAVQGKTISATLPYTPEADPVPLAAESALQGDPRP